MPDIAQARAEKAYQKPRVGDFGDLVYSLGEIREARIDAYVLGWTESQREPISDAEVEAAAHVFADAVVPMEDDSVFYFAARGSEDIEDAGPHLVHLQRMRAALTAAAQARVSAESEKG